jgi:hypothetical protein
MLEKPKRKFNTKHFDDRYDYVKLLGEGSYGKAHLVRSIADKVKFIFN